MRKKQKFIDFNDDSIPIGVRKVAYVKYAMSKGTSEINAKKQANKKFGFDTVGKRLLVIIVAGEYKWSRSDVLDNIKQQGTDARKYESIRHIEMEVGEFQKKDVTQIKKERARNGEDVAFALFADGW